MKKEKPIWKRISSRVVYGNSWVKVLEDAVVQPDGSRSIYTVMEGSPANYIIAQDKDGSIFLLREYRYPLGKDIYQLPAGIIGMRESELGNARKELEEETGITASKWRKLGRFYPFSGRTNMKINVYLATELDTKNISVNQEGDESIWDIIKVDRDKLKKMIKKNEIECGITLAALNFYLNKK